MEEDVHGHESDTSLCLNTTVEKTSKARRQSRAERRLANAGGEAAATTDDGWATLGTLRQGDLLPWAHEPAAYGGAERCSQQ